MNSLIQTLNDKSIELDQLLTDFDRALADTVEIETYWEDETGRHNGEINTYDEDGIERLKGIYYRLEKILEG
jgi:hypothetical protein